MGLIMDPAEVMNTTDLDRLQMGDGRAGTYDIIQCDSIRGVYMYLIILHIVMGILIASLQVWGGG